MSFPSAFRHPHRNREPEALMILPVSSSPSFFEPAATPARLQAVRERTRSDPRPWAVPERFTAEMVLRDLVGCAGDAGESERVVARYIVARIATWDAVVAADPEGELACAIEYTALLPQGDERRALEGVVRGSVEGRPHLLATSLRVAADFARAAGHAGGAFLMYREAFAVARRATERVEAARAARGIEGLARDAGAGRVARAWSARARRLERAHPDPRAIMEGMAAGYTREQRATLERAVRQGEALCCPVCGERVAESRLAPRRDVAYVRQRVWLLCSGCRRSATLDVSEGGRP
jgi:hypothetical protein